MLVSPETKGFYFGVLWGYWYYSSFSFVSAVWYKVEIFIILNLRHNCHNILVNCQNWSKIFLKSSMSLWALLSFWDMLIFMSSVPVCTFMVCSITGTVWQRYTIRTRAKIQRPNSYLSSAKRMNAWTSLVFILIDFNTMTMLISLKILWHHHMLPNTLWKMLLFLWF